MDYYYTEDDVKLTIPNKKGRSNEQPFLFEFTAFYPRIFFNESRIFGKFLSTRR